MDNYEIVVEGHLKSKRFSMFEGLEISLLSSGRTKVQGTVDQPTLFALLNHIRDLGLTLVLVRKSNQNPGPKE